MYVWVQIIYHAYQVHHVVVYQAYQVHHVVVYQAYQVHHVVVAVGHVQRVFHGLAEGTSRAQGAMLGVKGGTQEWLQAVHKGNICIHMSRGQREIEVCLGVTASTVALLIEYTMV